MNNVVRTFLKQNGIDLKKKKVDVNDLLKDAWNSQKTIKGNKEDLGRKHDEILHNQENLWIQKKYA